MALFVRLLTMSGVTKKLRVAFEATVSLVSRDSWDTLQYELSAPEPTVISSVLLPTIPVEPQNCTLSLAAGIHDDVAVAGGINGGFTLEGNPSPLGR